MAVADAIWQYNFGHKTTALPRKEQEFFLEEYGECKDKKKKLKIRSASFQERRRRLQIEHSKWEEKGGR